MSPLKANIIADIKAMMKAQDKDALRALRMLSAEIKQKEVDERIELSDTDVLAIISKMLKQRKESIKQFADAGRDDLVARERAEVQVIEQYLPKQLSEDEIAIVVTKIVSTSGVDSIKDMGKVMALLKSQLAGKADMSLVSQLVKQALS